MRIDKKKMKHNLSVVIVYIDEQANFFFHRNQREGREEIEEEEKE